ncbi:glutathione S-transferase U17-like [Curcuma longa]|uniref:glutathione S-transferase U17-like n=1 Tax=Curcuma longa TaxID=136217 RepID=UPI003D9E94EA
MADVKLIGSPLSPYVLRAILALSLKKVEYELLEEKFGEKSELLLKSNPIYKKIPVLIHHDRPICESAVIVEYIDEVWPESGFGAILPADAYHRALHRFWTYYVDDKWFPSLVAIGKAETEEAKAEAVERVRAGLLLLEEAFVKLSEGKAFFGGDRVAFLDVMFGCFVNWIVAAEELVSVELLDEATVPALHGWAVRFREHEAVKEVMPDSGRVLGFLKILQAKWKADAAAAKKKL